MRYEERPAENLDLLGLAGANAAVAFTGTFVVNGSPTKTAMVDDAGGRSQVAHLTAALVVLGVVLFLARPLSFLPNAVLSTIVFLIGVKLIDLTGMRELFVLMHSEFWIALLTAATVVVFTVMHGIAVAVVLSLIDQVRHTYRPRTRVIVKDSDGRWVGIPAAPDRLAAPGILAYRFEANLFYANASLFMEEIRRLVSTSREPVRGLVLDASGIDNVDYTAAKMLRQGRDDLKNRGVAVAVVAAHGPVLDVLRRFGVGDSEEGPIAYPTIDSAIGALGARAAP